MEKTIKIIIGIFVAVILLTGAFAGGFIAGHLLPSSGQSPFRTDLPTPYTAPTVAPEQQNATPAELQTLFAPFWETWNLIHAQYVVQPVDDVKLMEGAIKGMLQTLEVGRNYYLNAKQFEERECHVERQGL